MAGAEDKGLSDAESIEDLDVPGSVLGEKEGLVVANLRLDRYSHYRRVPICKVLRLCASLAVAEKLNGDEIHGICQLLVLILRLV